MQTITYRDLKVNIGTRRQAFQILTNFLIDGVQHQVITLNPEYVVLARNNPALSRLTQKASLCLIDGVGLAFAIRHFGSVERYPGADFVPELCSYCASHQLKVGIVLLPSGLSKPEQVKNALKQKFTSLSAEAWYTDEKLPTNIQKFQPTLLLVALGQPQQDFWIAEHLTAFPSIKLAVGVGGAIDFLTGARQRAPRLMRFLGLEWLWRLITQPRRLPRIFRAIIGFWYTIIFK